MIEFLLVLGVIWIVAAIIQDFKQREVANWLNFSLIIFALAFRAFYSVFFNNYMVFIFGLVGLLITFILANLFYYSRLFAGGDAKLFIALGAIIPFEDSFYENNLIFLVFLISFLLGGVLYSLIYSLILTYNNKEKFNKSFKEIFNKKLTNLYFIFAFSLAFVIFSLISKDFIYLIIPAFFIIIFLLYVYTKSVEQSCMLIYVKAINLRPGDWLEKEIKIKNRTIMPNWEGLSEEEIKFIKENYRKKVLIKQGIPFTPAFLIAFLVIILIKYFFNGDFKLFNLFEILWL